MAKGLKEGSQIEEGKGRCGQGRRLNQVGREKVTLNSLKEEKRRNFEEIALEERLKSEKIDVSLYGYSSKKGAIHPVTSTMNKIIDYFTV